MSSISDRAHARDLAELEEERRRREALMPNAYRVLAPLCERYLDGYPGRGADTEADRDLLALSDAIFDEMDAGRDIPAEVADGILDALDAYPEPGLFLAPWPPIPEVE